MEMQEEDLNTQVALKIARMGLRGIALGMSDKNLKDLVVAIYDEHFDETGEGWNPYDDDLGQIRDVLTPSDEEDEDQYNLEEIIREEVKKHAMWNLKTGKKTMADGEKHKELAAKGEVHFDPEAVIDALEKEGGAAGLDAIVKHTGADKEELESNIEDIPKVGKHKDGDYILDDDGKISVAAEQMIREAVRLFLEKRKKSKSKKRKGNEICAAGKAWAKRTFDTYPSAYANLAASKYCKDPNYAKDSKRKKKANEQLEIEEGELKNWLKKDWVRVTSSGKIAGKCGTSKDKKNPDRCLPRSKAQSLSKSERAATARKKKSAQKTGKDTGKTSNVANTRKGKVTKKYSGQ